MNDYRWSVKVSDWSSKIVELHRQDFRNGVMEGAYGNSTVDDIARHLTDYMDAIVRGLKNTNYIFILRSETVGSCRGWRRFLE